MRSDRNKRSKSKLAKQQVSEQSVMHADSTTAVSTIKNKKKKHRLNWKRFLLFLFCIFLLVCIAVGIYVGRAISAAPDIDTSEIYTILSESTVIYDDEGNEIDTVFSEQNRTNVEYKDLPQDLIDAVVSLEDKTFWDHHGFNFIRILGAIKESIFGGGQISGTSTITQQLARNLFLKDKQFDYDLTRKIQEAYYTVIIEKELSKEEILTAYLNTIYFGYGSYGVQAASHAYFSKDVKDLSLAQCAALASLPQAPDECQLVEFVGSQDVSAKDKNILKTNSRGTYIANDASKERRLTCLSLMLEQDYITQKEYDKASSTKLKKMLNPTYNSILEKSAYFEDYVIDQVIEALMKEKEWDYDTAWNKVYNGGLKIYSTLDAQAQQVIETEFDNDANFPASYTYSTPNMDSYDSYFDADGNFTLRKGEFLKRKDGGLVIKTGKRLNVYETTVNGETDYSIEFKNMYKYENGSLYTISGGFINIPQNYKIMNKKGNIQIPAEFFEDEDYKDFFIFNDDGTITIPSASYTLNQQVVQPQAAMTIVENSTGYIKAMVGGRKTAGRRLHNRAISPEQPGSSIKPLAVYSAAIAQSAEEAANGTKHQFTNFKIDKQGDKLWGYYLTPASIVIDEKTTINGKVWPQNAGGAGYSGPMTMRSALQQSINTCAVKIFLQVGADYSANLVEKFGITTLEREGSVNDMNPAGLALGGLTNGVTTLDMASAYTVFPNNGTRRETTAFTKIVDSQGETLVDRTKTKRYRVLDSGVAWIMTDMLKSVVSQGIGYPAAISGVQVGGKTGTTDHQVDIWFDGFTPSYSASLWIGVDQNCNGTEMSGPAARLWGKIMNQIDGAKQGSYKSMPSNVISSGGEYYISGTQGGVGSIKDLEKKVSICKETGYLATPDCPKTEKKGYFDFGNEDDIPRYYCHKHNADPEKYPINPDETYVPFVKPEDPKEKDDPEKPNPDDPNPDDPNPDDGDDEEQDAA